MITMKPVMVVDYGMGNLHSVSRKLTKIGVEATICGDPKELLSAHKLVLPGVGHFKKAVLNLKTSGLWDALNELVLIKQVPILGICLGMQLMGEHSEEGDVDGLGWFQANVVRFDVKDTIKYKVPHMGWNTVKRCKESLLFQGVDENAEFYFVHAYHMKPNEIAQASAFTNYEYDFCSAMEKENIYGIQFHPEKSHDAGEKVLLNFAKM
jgi:imidazole glycerol-phosphate synthase subunit HisH